MKFNKVNHSVTVVKPKNEETRSSTFHEAVGPCMAYGQFFGMIPVDGILADDESQLEFRWKSLKTIYSMTFLLCGTVESCLGTRRLLRLGFNMHYVEGLMFFLLAALRGFLFFHLAKKWKEIMKFWQKCENVFLHEPYRVKGFNLKVKIRVVFAVLTVLSISKFWRCCWRVETFQGWKKRLNDLKDLLNKQGCRFFHPGSFVTSFKPVKKHSNSDFLPYSWTFFIPGNCNKWQLSSARELHSKVEHLLGKLSGTLPPTFTLQHSLQHLRNAIIRSMLTSLILLTQFDF